MPNNINKNNDFETIKLCIAPYVNPNILPVTQLCTNGYIKILEKKFEKNNMFVVDSAFEIIDLFIKSKNEKIMSANNKNHK